MQNSNALENRPKGNEYPPDFVMSGLRVFLYLFSKAIWQIKFTGTENIPADLKGGLIVAPNHQTYLDPFWIVLPIRRKLRFMAWDKACARPLIGRIIKFLGAFPVNIDGRGKDAYIKSIRVLKEGATLVIFPEGSREFSDGKLLEFKSGAARIALEAAVPILPVTLKGANRVWAQDMKYPKLFRKIEIIYHPLFEIPRCPEGKDLKEYAYEITDKLEEIIASAMN